MVLYITNIVFIHKQYEKSIIFRKGCGNLDIKQLYYFCTIVEEGQVTRAAKKLHMAQPPLSQQLKQLEDELNVKLFDRNGRSMTLTEAGKVLYEKSKRLISQIQDTEKEVKEIGAGVKGILALGITKSCLSLLPKRIHYFRHMYPEVRFRLREGDSYHISELIKKRDIELAITRLPLETKDFSMIRLPSEPYLLVIPKSWKKFHQKNSIKVKEIKGMPLLLLHRINGSGQFEIIVNECRRHGFEPKVVCECPDVSILLSLVDAEVGATIVPSSAFLQFYSSNVIALKMEDAGIMAEAAVVWLKDRYLSKSAHCFIETFKHDHDLQKGDFEIHAHSFATEE